MKKHSAFTLIEVILLVIIVGLFALIGWQVWNAQTSQQQAVTNTETAPMPTPDPQARMPYLLLEEHKVRIPTNEAIKNLVIKEGVASTYDQNDMMYPIAASDLDKQWTCEPDENGLTSTIGSISVTTSALRAGPGQPSISKKIGDTTYGYEISGTNCVDSDAHTRLVDAFKAQFEKLESY